MMARMGMEIDWGSYFREFSLVHGGEPVLYGENPEVKRSGRLLFPDGWMYSSWNPKGPEYPPPRDERKRLELIRSYWVIRRDALRGEYERLKVGIESLMVVQQARSARLQIPQMITMEDESGKRLRRRQIGPIDFQSLMDRLSDLAGLIRACQVEIDDPHVPDSVTEDFRPAGLLDQLSDICAVGEKKT